MSYNPFSGWRVTGNWEDHMSYSLGGTDYPLPYGSALPAPASGTLRASGGTGERRAGEVGSAGRRSILDLDTPLGDMVSIVFQHQSRFGEHGKHYDERETLGWSGASANGRDWGGDVHLHIHGLDKHGNRVDYTTHINAASTAGETITLITSGDDDMRVYANNKTDAWVVGGPGTWQAIPAGEGGYYEEAFGDRIALSPEAFTRAASVCLASRSPEFGVYANTATNLWAVGGPGFWYPIPGGEGALWEARFGARKAVSADEFERLRVAYSR